MSAVELAVPVDVAAPADVVWATVTDWPGQRDWMLGTTVTVEGEGDGRRLGARVNAFTGIGPLGFTDPMEIVEWDPPRRCVMRHDGAVVRGTGVFEVTELAPARSRVLWTERMDLPLGAAGRLAWPLARPVVRAGVAVSLRRMATVCERRYRNG
ncbi:SRPBCC family protein [Actinomycetes bacterium KLBMP 9759]